MPDLLPLHPHVFVLLAPFVNDAAHHSISHSYLSSDSSPSAPNRSRPTWPACDRCGPRCGWERNLVPDLYGIGPYHAASPVCLAAVFQGLLPPGGQGCIEYRLTGAQPEFAGGLGHAGLHARAYPSSFPRSFELRGPAGGATGGHCGGPGWPVILPVSLLGLLLAGLVVLPSRALWWGWLVTWGFWYVLFVSQPLAQVSQHRNPRLSNSAHQDSEA